MMRKRKRYSKPRKPFEKERIEKENLLLEKYGLKNKKEIWKTKEKAGRIRREAKKLLTSSREEQEAFLSRLKKLGFVEENARIDDALAIEEETILNRRLQTIVLKEFARTARQARQLVVHGHVAIGERIVDVPSYLVSKEEEQKIKMKEKSKNKNKKTEEKTREEKKQQTEEKTREEKKQEKTQKEKI